MSKRRSRKGARVGRRGGVHRRSPFARIDGIKNLDQSVPSDRLHQVMIEARSFPLLAILLAPISGHRDESGMLKSSTTQSLCNGIAVQTRQSQIQEDDLWPEFFCDGECRRAVIGNLYFVPEGLEVHRLQVGCITIIVHNQNPPL